MDGVLRDVLGRFVLGGLLGAVLGFRVGLDLDHGGGTDLDGVGCGGDIRRSRGLAQAVARPFMSPATLSATPRSRMT